VESEEIWMDLHALHRHGWSISALARKFQLNRRTVRRELAADAARGYPPRALRYPFTPGGWSRPTARPRSGGGRVLLGWESQPSRLGQA
jgi:hypothetical protein